MKGRPARRDPLNPGHDIEAGEHQEAPAEPPRLQRVEQRIQHGGDQESPQELGGEEPPHGVAE